ncbi:hypothetical protein H5410_021679 [Solanum commersonii]|uniref:Uncharacterized protein n=1 Tax=Solanum commersonii TaxID=4109 RepID=A0A9J5ZHX1_SOLCO|nr:hypothetical protein H5410_021679 [Solanum commersonii]
MRHRVDLFLTSMGSGDGCQDEDSSAPIRGYKRYLDLGKNPSLSISMFTKLASFLAFMKPTLTDISSIFLDGRSGESIQLDAAYLDAVLVHRTEGRTTIDPGPMRKGLNSYLP